MRLNLIKNTALLFVIIFLSSETKCPSQNQKSLLVGANQLESYLPLIKNKKLGIVANQTSVIFKGPYENNFTHLVDSLKELGISIQKVFAPEHGYRGQADAGEYIKNGVDIKTGLEIVSLYGKNRKPSPETLKDLEIVLFDIQDVGTRFYTYVSTLHYMMEACATLNIPLILLDRPNPNGHYIDGPVLDIRYKSFIGMHPVPIVHGMTLGEFANMINGEGWLNNNLKCNLTVIPISNYNHKTPYLLPIKPSPNLPNKKAINLYPSLCLFEGTNVSVGRGTKTQFQVFGSPYFEAEKYTYRFTPKPNFGAKNPKFKGQICYGKYLKKAAYLNEIQLSWLIEAYQNSKDKSVFFNSFFTKLAGQTTLQSKIENGWTASEIKKSWTNDLKLFIEKRAKYLLYP